MKVTLCDPYAWEDPLNFLRNAWGKSFQCAQGRKPCYSEVLNQIIFIYLFAFLATAVVAIFLQYGMAIPIGLIFTTLYLIPAFRTLQTIQSTGDPGSSQIENFDDVAPVQAASPDAMEFTRPTASNPFMNVLVNEIKYNPTKPAAYDITDPRCQVC
jgi:hypothetical protein